MQWELESQWENCVMFTGGGKGSTINRINLFYTMIWNFIIQCKMCDMKDRHW